MRWRFAKNLAGEWVLRCSYFPGDDVPLSRLTLERGGMTTFTDAGNYFTVRMRVPFRVDVGRPRRRREAMSKFDFFDHLSRHAPDKVSAGSCQPIWITVTVPRDTAPGLYAGTLTVRVSAQSFTIPVRMQVMDWQVPAPDAFRTVMALEPSPYGVAAHYKVPLWSATRPTSSRRPDRVQRDAPAVSGGAF